MSANGVNLAYGQHVSKMAKKTRLSSIREFNQPIKKTKDYLELVEGKSSIGEDLDRYRRLEQHPDILKIIDEYEEINKGLIKEIRSREIPFDQLKYSGPGTAKNYLKRMISNEFFDAMKRQE